MDGSFPIRAAKWMGFAYAASITVILLIGADAADALLLSLLFIPWIVGPAGVAALCVRAARSSRGAWVFLAVEMSVIASTAVAWVYLIFVNPDPQNSIAMAIFVPLYQYGAVVASISGAYLLGWRARNGFLNG